MARPNRLKELEALHGDLHKVIPPLVNLKGQAGAAQVLGVTAPTLSVWLKDHGYQMVITYERRDLETQGQTA